MPDFSGFLTPFLAAFDPDGRKTDELMGKGEGADEEPESFFDLFRKKRKTAGGGGGTADPNQEPDLGSDDPQGKGAPPPDGFSSWAEVGRHNQQVLDAALQRQNQLEGMGAKYNNSDGTWTLPDGRTTTLMDEDPGPSGVPVTHDWSNQDPNSDPRTADPNA